MLFIAVHAFLRGDSIFGLGLAISASTAFNVFVEGSQAHLLVVRSAL